jgi:glycosyltransferase involved in cell wall biosynthesis
VSTLESLSARHGVRRGTPRHPLAPERTTLVVLVKRFPRLSETFVLNEILELRRQGLPVQVMAMLDPGEAHAQPEAEALRPEVTYLRADGRGRLVWRMLGVAVRHPLGVLRGLGWLARRHSRGGLRAFVEGLLLVAACRPLGRVHVHAHFAHGPAAAAFVAHQVSGLPYSFTAHAKDLYTTRPAVVAERAAAATFVATCTNANRVYLEAEVGVPHGRVRVCRHGVDIDRFAGLERRPVPGRILSVGRLVPKKGYTTLLLALSELAERGIDFDCRIIGSGPMRDQLETAIVTLGLIDRVRIEPGRPQVALLDDFSAASIFALTPAVQPNGDRDGIPNVIQEALAAGIPVVSTAISGIPEVVHHGVNGFLVPPDNPRFLADALAHLLGAADVRARMGDAGRGLAARHGDLYTCVAPLAGAFRAGLAR